MLKRRDSLGFCAVLGACAALAVACGSDDKKTEVVVVGESGAPATYPPALGPENCVTQATDVKLSQPDGAAVWGGIAVLELKVDGPSVSSFDIEQFDPALGIWTQYWLGNQVQGQRDDDTYLLVVTPYFSDATKDLPVKLRVRPEQQGCPRVEWAETEEISAGDPLAETSWKASLSGSDISNEFQVLRQSVPDAMALPATELGLGDATLTLDFGKKGAFTETLELALIAEKGAPFNGCALTLTFTGSYTLTQRNQYQGTSLNISALQLDSSSGTKCAFPAPTELALGMPNASIELPPMLRQGISINYLPLVYTEPQAPTWSDTGLGQIFQQLPQLLFYSAPKETGNLNGNVYLPDLTFVKQ